MEIITHESGPTRIVPPMPTTWNRQTCGRDVYSQPLVQDPAKPIPGKSRKWSNARADIRWRGSRGSLLPFLDLPPSLHFLALSDTGSLGRLCLDGAA